MSNDPSSGPPDQEPGPAAIQTRRWGISLVWIVPIVAALVGLSMVAHRFLSAGPVITIAFRTGEGLIPNKTQVKYRNVMIGEVTAVELSNDRGHVTATVQLQKVAEPFTARDTQFWVVRPRIGTGGVSGLDTLVSGDFIAADAGAEKARARHFTGLEKPPAVTYGEPGKRFMLRAGDLGSLDVGSPVYFRKIPVGQVVSYALDKAGKGVILEIFVHAPNDIYVTENTRFWNASGVNININANGLSLNTESLSSILMGGIVFRAPDYSPGDTPAADGANFNLFDDQQTALAPPSGKPQYLRLRFDQAFKGLSVGAPVEFQGLEIGKVVSVDLDFDAEKQTFPLTVGAIVYPQRMGRAQEKLIKSIAADADDEDARARLLAAFVERGLRAQARTGNLLTGQMLIVLEFHPEAEKVVFDPHSRPVTIPTLPARTERMQDQAQQLISKFNKLPLDRIANHLDANLSELQKMLAAVNGEVLPGVNDTLRDVRGTLGSTNAMLAEDSPQRAQLGDTLTELERSARALRELVDYLNRHPEALLRGRPKSSAPRLPEESKPEETQ